MSKLIDLTNNIRLLEFEPILSEKYLEAFKTIDLGELTSIPWTIGQRRSTVYKKQRPQTLFRSTCQIFMILKFFLFGSSINGAIENGLVGSVFL